MNRQRFVFSLVPALILVLSILACGESGPVELSRIEEEIRITNWGRQTFDIELTAGQRIEGSFETVFGSSLEMLFTLKDSFGNSILDGVSLPRRRGFVLTRRPLPEVDSVGVSVVRRHQGV